MRYVLFLVSWFITECVKVPLFAEVEIIPKNYIHFRFVPGTAPHLAAPPGEELSRRSFWTLFFLVSPIKDPWSPQALRKLCPNRIEPGCQQRPRFWCPDLLFLSGHMSRE